MDAIIIFGAKYLIYAIILIAVIYVLIQEKRRQKEILFFTIVVLPLSYIFAKVMSLLYYDPRPFVVGNFAPLIPHVMDNGFPSDHTLLSCAVAMVIFAFNKKIGVFLFVLALAVGISRVAAGVHHLVDILASALIVITAYLLASRWIMPRLKSRV